MNSKNNHAHCDHSHGPDHGHDQPWLSRGLRWLLSVLIVSGFMVLGKPFIIGQMLVRVTSYAGNSSYNDVIRMCKKIIAFDKDNLKAWTSLGYAYMDSFQPALGMEAFGKVLAINPEDKGAASYELGKAYYAQGDYSKAIEYFERIRSGGARRAALLEADILKYRHGTLGFRSLNSMQTLLEDLADSYQHTGNGTQAAEVQKQGLFYKNRHRTVFF